MRSILNNLKHISSFFNKLLKLVKFKNNNSSQFLSIGSVEVTDDVIKLLKFIDVNALQPINILFIIVQLDVLK